MTARLGFAIAVNVEPEILLIDEVLAVGDEAFQRKCLDRIKQFQREGRTILLVTHAADMVRQICDRAAVLDHGNLVAVGPPGEAVLAFRDHLRRKGADDPGRPRRPVAAAQPPVEITNAKVEYPDPARSYIKPGEPVTVRVDVPRAPSGSTTSCSRSRSTTRRATCSSGRTPISWTATPDTCTATARSSSSSSDFPVLDGVYLISIGLHSHDGGEIYDQRAEKDVIEVMNPGREVGLVHFRMQAHTERNAPGLVRRLTKGRPIADAEETGGEDRTPRRSGSMLSGAGVLVVGRYVVAALAWVGTLIVVRELSKGEFGALPVHLLAARDHRLHRRPPAEPDRPARPHGRGRRGGGRHRRLVPRHAAGDRASSRTSIAMAWVLHRPVPGRRRARDRGRRAEPRHPLGRVRDHPALRGAALAARRRDLERARPDRPDRDDDRDLGLRRRVDPLVLVVHRRQRHRADAVARARHGPDGAGPDPGRVAAVVGVAEGSGAARARCRARHRLLPHRHRHALAARHVHARSASTASATSSPTCSARSRSRSSRPALTMHGGGLARRARRVPPHVPPRADHPDRRRGRGGRGLRRLRRAARHALLHRPRTRTRPTPPGCSSSARACTSSPCSRSRRSSPSAATASTRSRCSSAWC